MAIVLLNFNQIYVVQGPQNKYKIQNIHLFTFLTIMYKMNYLYLIQHLYSFITYITCIGSPLSAEN